LSWNDEVFEKFAVRTGLTNPKCSHCPIAALRPLWLPSEPTKKMSPGPKIWMVRESSEAVTKWSRLRFRIDPEIGQASQPRARRPRSTGASTCHLLPQTASRHIGVQ
jgi:hypothetical protein